MRPKAPTMPQDAPIHQPPIYASPLTISAGGRRKARAASDRAGFFLVSTPTIYICLVSFAYIRRNYAGAHRVQDYGADKPVATDARSFAILRELVKLCYGPLDALRPHMELVVPGVGPLARLR